MTNIRMRLAAAILLPATIAGITAIAVAQQTPEAEKPAGEKAGQTPSAQDPMMEMMAKWKDMNAKGPEHEKFKKMEGVWSTEMKWWMSPDSEPTVTTGVAKFSLILDGRFIEQRYSCDWMGDKYEGLGIEGFDRIKNKYVSIWLDNQCTGVFISEGTADETGKVCTYHGKMDDPLAGVKDKVVRSVAREINDNQAIFEMYDTTPDGKEFKSMEITYTRKRALN